MSKEGCVWWGRKKKIGRGYMGSGEKWGVGSGEWGIRVWWEKRQGVHGQWGKKKKGIKKKKEMESGVYVYGGKKRRVEKGRRKKKLKWKKLNWFYLYVHFIWCKVQNCENLFKECL